MTIVQLQERDFDETIDFLNLVFGGAYPHDFEKMLPACYRPSEMHRNFAVREAGHIRAIVGLFPRIWALGEQHLTVGCIGGVSTHPKFRNRGYMSALMTHAIAHMQQQGMELSWLSGRRQRYRPFGYEIAGAQIQMTFTPSNLPKGDVAQPVRIERLEPHHTERLDEVWAAHEQNPLRHVRTREDLYNHLVAWHCEPHVIIDPDGAFVGWLMFDRRTETILEMNVADDKAYDTIGAWIRATDRRTKLLLSPISRIIHRLGADCEDYTLEACGNWRIFDWKRTLEALLPIRASQCPPLSGAVTLCIEGADTLQISCDGTCFSIERKEASGSDLSCDELVAMRLLFGPLSPSLTCSLPQSAAVLAQWCPLPLYWATSDGV